MKKRIEVTQIVEVTIDETKFTPEFFADFNQSITNYGTDLDEHLKHLAMQHTLNGKDDHSFIEGYGPATDMGIKFNVVDEYADLQLADD